MRKLLLFLYLPIALLAQDQQLSVWRIEVAGSTLASSGSEYTAILENSQHQKVADADLSPDNSFEFRFISYGDYWLTICDRQGRTVYQGLLTAHSGTSREMIDLPPARHSDAPPGGPVSVADLRHPPSRKAFAALATAQHLSEAGQFTAAAGQLEKATRLSPDWADAHTNLSAAYIRLGRYEDSISEANRAIVLSKPNGTDFGNIAYAEYRLNRRTEAIQSARKGLAIEPNSPKLHYILGALLAMNRATLAESIPHLELAARTLPSAQATLAQARQALR